VNVHAFGARRSVQLARVAHSGNDFSFRMM
jgi:hypothetical protein